MSRARSWTPGSQIISGMNVEVRGPQFHCLGEWIVRACPQLATVLISFAEGLPILSRAAVSRKITERHTWKLSMSDAKLSCGPGGSEIRRKWTCEYVNPRWPHRDSVKWTQGEAGPRPMATNA